MKVLKTLLMAAILTPLSSVPVDAQQDGAGKSIFERHAAIIGNLSKKDASGNYLVADAAVAVLKADIAFLLGADPANLKLFTHPDTGSGLLGDIVQGIRIDNNSIFTLGAKDAKIVAPYRNLTFAGLFNDQGKEKYIIAWYEDGDYKAAIGVRPCTGKLSVLRDGGSILSEIKGPDGEPLLIQRAAGVKNVTVNGQSVRLIFR